MSPLFESQEAKEFNDKLIKAVDALYDITSKINHEELKQTVSDVRARINDPYMFVIVGEVKAGKSSFINALLDSKEEICKVAPSPMTDTIQQITYGPEQKIEEINPYLKRIYQPIEILKEIAIVDTPGTNTIIDHHQEITEKFIPSSDLIVFVFESKNPYRQSSWEFFDYINEYRINDAKTLLKEQTDLTVLEILYKIGFNSKSSFYTAFKKETQQTPTKYRKSNT